LRREYLRYRVDRNARGAVEPQEIAQSGARRGWAATELQIVSHFRSDSILICLSGTDEVEHS
jgi:hypothetical protein